MVELILPVTFVSDTRNENQRTILFLAQRNSSRTFIPRAMNEI